MTCRDPGARNSISARGRARGPRCSRRSTRSRRKVDAHTWWKPQHVSRPRARRRRERRLPRQSRGRLSRCGHSSDTPRRARPASTARTPSPAPAAARAATPIGPARSSCPQAWSSTSESAAAPGRAPSRTARSTGRSYATRSGRRAPRARTTDLGVPCGASTIAQFRSTRQDRFPYG